MRAWHVGMLRGPLHNFGSTGCIERSRRACHLLSCAFHAALKL
jgi:hypothetical protein